MSSATRLLSYIALATAWLFLFFPVRSNAQSYDWECVWDFTTSAHGFTVMTDFSPALGVWQNGVGWTAQYAQTTSEWTNRYRVSRNLGGTFTVTYVSVTHQFQRGSTSQSPNFAVRVGSNIVISQTLGTTQQTYTHVYTGSASGSTVDMRVFAYNGVNTSIGNRGTATAKELVLRGTGTAPALAGCDTTAVNLVKPLQDSQRTLWFDDSIDSTHGWYWVAPNEAFVHAMMDGTVTQITPLTALNCTEFGMYTTATTLCGFNDPTVSIHQMVYSTNTSIVKISSGTQAVLQVVDSRHIYVSLGQVVNQSCVIGLTGYAYGLTSTGFYTTSWTMLNGDYTETDTADMSEPNPSPYCNAQADLENCIGDATFRTSVWVLENAVTDEYGAVVSSGGYIAATYNLDPARHPSLVARGGISGTTGDVRLQLGQTIQSFSLPVSAGQVAIAGAAHVADNAGLYTVAFYNFSNAPVRVDFLCVTNTRDNDGNEINPPPIPPTPEQSACVFSNSSFDQDSGWALENAESGRGEVYLQNNGVVRQTITLAPGTYYLTAVGSVWAYNSYEPDEQNEDGDIALSWAFPTVWNAVGDVTFGEFARRNNVVTYQATIVISSATTAQFAVRVVVSNAPGGVRGFALRSLCLSTSPRGSVDGGESGGGVFEPQCNTISTPAGSGLGTWTTWLWAKLGSFFKCELMVLLNEMYKLGIRAWTTTSWAIRWNIMVANNGVTWLTTQLLPWLAGYFSNMSLAANGGSCDNIFCLLVSAFELVGQFLDFIGNILTAVFDIARALVEQVVALSVQLRVFFDAVANGFQNATPAYVPILPTSCSTNPQSNGFCIVSWMFQHTVFSGTGALIIPLLISYGALSWLIWAIKELRRTLMDMGRVM